jgi:hypothetical protein
MGKSDFIFKYRVRNWPEYNHALVRRGSLTLWVEALLHNPSSEANHATVE